MPHFELFLPQLQETLLKVDNARLPERIAQAEKALVLRARELFHIAGDNIEEEQSSG